MQEQWANLIAYAWTRSDTKILDALRADPKKEIDRLKEEKPEGLGDISDLGSEGDYWGIPNRPENLKGLDQTKLEQFLSENPDIFGIMQFCCI
jgi:hypothetical protein